MGGGCEKVIKESAPGHMMGPGADSLITFSDLVDGDSGGVNAISSFEYIVRTLFKLV